MHSAIYRGNVRHRRFSPRTHDFNYSLYMLALDVDELEGNSWLSEIMSSSRFKAISINQKDYLVGEPKSLRARIINKVKSLNGKNDIARIVMLVQPRTFGIYFSPANFYFCYDQNDECSQMLCEVSNTPWNQRHYYLVDMKGDMVNDKQFHVSPFMDLNMSYVWKITPPTPGKGNLMVHIENVRSVGDEAKREKLFDATVALKAKTLNESNLRDLKYQLPLMSVKVVLGIYWQALKIFLKRIPFISYQHYQKTD